MRGNNNRDVEQLCALIQDLQIRVNHLGARNHEPRTPIAEARVIPDNAEEPPQPDSCNEQLLRPLWSRRNSCNRQSSAPSNLHE